MTEQELAEILIEEIVKTDADINGKFAYIRRGLADVIAQRLLPFIRAYAEQSATSAFLAGVRERDEEWKKALSRKGDVGPALAWKESIQAEDRERCITLRVENKRLKEKFEFMLKVIGEAQEREDNLIEAAIEAGIAYAKLQARHDVGVAVNMETPEKPTPADVRERLAGNPASHDQTL